MPAGAQYDIDSTFGSKKTLFKTRAMQFKNSYDKYNRTCDIQKDIQIYNARVDPTAAGVASYDVEKGMQNTKKRVPAFS